LTGDTSFFSNMLKYFNIIIYVKELMRLSYALAIILLLCCIWYICRESRESILKKHYYAYIGEQAVPEPLCTKTLEPERGIMAIHEAGDTLKDTVKTLDDPLSLDGLIQKSTETPDQKLQRSKDEEFDSKQLQGMAPPIEEFENNALQRQLAKAKYIY
jgi:hypothetical protein